MKPPATRNVPRFNGADALKRFSLSKRLPMDPLYIADIRLTALRYHDAVVRGGPRFRETEDDSERRDKWHEIVRGMSARTVAELCDAWLAVNGKVT